MSKQPMEFQKASAEAIVAHLKDHDRALCADEAGLGKTITASTVIQKLALQKLTGQLPVAKGWIMQWWNSLQKNMPECLFSESTSGGKKARRRYAFRVFYKTVTGKEPKEDNDKWQDEIAEKVEKVSTLTKPEEIRDLLIAIAQLYADCMTDNAGKLYKNWELGMPENLSNPMPAEPYRVLYICSNLAIAEQNTRELVSLPQRSRRSSTDRPDRLSTLWHYLEKYPTPFLEIYPITSTVSRQDTKGTKNEWKILKPLLLETLTKEEERNKGEAKTLEVFSPDLVIFDEFQRFLDIINLIRMENDAFDKMIKGLEDECSAANEAEDTQKETELSDRIDALQRCRLICEGLFAKEKKPKILMLSATPFRELQTSFLKSLPMKELVAFMGGDDVEYQKAVDENNIAGAEDILYNSCGIFRTERSRLMHKDPWSFHRIRCSDAGVLARAVSIGTSEAAAGNRGASFARNVPDLSVIPKVYRTGVAKNISVNTYEVENFPKEFTLDRFERFRQIVTAPREADVTENGTRIPMADAADLKRLLWIPPVAPSAPLGGVFAKYRDYSKALMYSDLAATPASVCKVLSDEFEMSGFKWNDDIKNAIQNGLEKMLGDENLASAVCGYLQRNGGTALADMDTNAVIQYCRDGCLADVIEEWRSFGVTTEEMCAVLNAKDHQDFAVNMTPELLNTAGSEKKASVRMCFNAPFLPFVLATTSIGAEGLDLHRYCCRLVHYSIPTDPIDLEQKNGRIDRYHSLAQRRRQVQIASYSEVQEAARKASGGMIPDWDAGEGGLHYYFLYTEHTSEKRRIEALFEDYRNYREKLGMKSAAYPESLNLCPFLRQK